MFLFTFYFHRYLSRFACNENIYVNIYISMLTDVDIFTQKCVYVCCTSLSVCLSALVFAHMCIQHKRKTLDEYLFYLFTWSAYLNTEFLFLIISVRTNICTKCMKQWIQIIQICVHEWFKTFFAFAISFKSGKFRFLLVIYFDDEHLFLYLNPKRWRNQYLVYIFFNSWAALIVEIYSVLQ